MFFLGDHIVRMIDVAIDMEDAKQVALDALDSHAAEKKRGISDALHISVINTEIKEARMFLLRIFGNLKAKEVRDLWQVTEHPTLLRSGRTPGDDIEGLYEEIDCFVLWDAERRASEALYETALRTYAKNELSERESSTILSAKKTILEKLKRFIHLGAPNELFTSAGKDTH